MGEKLTKEQIQEEYNKTIALFGQMVYRVIAPIYELTLTAKHLLLLNQQMHQRLSEEAESKKP